MTHARARQFYIDGDWVELLSDESFTLVDPATERAVGDFASAQDPVCPPVCSTWWTGPEGPGRRSSPTRTPTWCPSPVRRVPAAYLDEAKAAASDVAHATLLEALTNDGYHMGPVVNQTQFETIRELIHSGIEQGATLLAGGAERPDGRTVGFYIRPTVFADVTPDMRIWREEIFGPMVCLMGYEDQDEAVRHANDTVYGLAAYVTGGTPERALAIARRLRAGQVAINYDGCTTATPFGGYGPSGNGREKGGGGWRNSRN